MRTVYLVSRVALVVSVVLLVAGIGWLVFALMTDSLVLPLWGQALVVLGLCALVALAALASRLLVVSALIRRFLG